MITPPDTRSLYKSPDGHRRALEVYEWMCQLITVPYHSVWIDTPVGATHVLCAGHEDSPPLVLLHGQGASAPTWSAQINLLAQHYRLFVPDVPASMGKSTATRLPRAGTAAGEWLSATMNGLHLENAHVAGISNGAWLIFKLATVAPHKIRSASLLSAAGLVRTSLRLMRKAMPMLMLGPLLSPQRKAQIFAQIMGVPGTPTPEEDLRMFTILLSDFRTEPTPAPLPTHELGCLTAPTQLLIGEYEAAFPAPRVTHQAQAVLPNLRHTEVLPNVGHGMITENAPLVSARIHDFVCRVEAGDFSA